MFTSHVARSSLVVSVPVAIALLHSPVSRAIAQDSAFDRRASVVLLDFNVATNKDQADWAPLAKGIPQMLMTELSRNPDIRIVERERLQAVLDELKLTPAALVDPQTAAKVGKLIGARYMVSGGIAVIGNKQLRLDVHGFKVETAVHEYNDALLGKADDVLELIAKLGQKASKEFDPTPFDAPTGRDAGNTSKPTKAGLRLAMLLGNAVDLKDKKDFDGAKVLVKQALALVPGDPSATALLSSLESK